MIDQKQWMDEMAGLTRASIETSVRNLDMLREQTEKAIDMTLKSVATFHGESYKGVETLVGGLKKAGKIYKKSAVNAFNVFNKKTG